MWGVDGGSLTRHRSEKGYPRPACPRRGPDGGLLAGSEFRDRKEKLDQSLGSILLPLIGGVSSSIHHLRAQVGK